MKVRIHVNPIAFQDRRTAEQLRHSDNVEEARWRARVRLNEKRRAIKSRWPVSLVGRLGHVGPNRQGGRQ